MSPSPSEIVLASASPRRREILTTLGIRFRVRPSGWDERSLDLADDHEFVRRVAEKKRDLVIESLPPPDDGAWVLAADTIVSVGDRRLGKPRDDTEAVSMIELLAGRSHWVRTAIALGRARDNARESEVVSTQVWFRDASRSEVLRYVATAEGQDKAGAYAIQGLAGGFVHRIEGSYTNVVGLPAAEVIELLLKHEALGQWP